MVASRLQTVLLAGAGLALLFSTPAMAQEAGQCAQRLDEIEQQVSEIDLGPQRQKDIQQVVGGARTLAETGDQEGCMRVVAELDGLMATLEEASSQQDGDQQQSQGGAPQDQQGAGQAEQETQAGGQQPSPSAKEQLPDQTSGGQQTQESDQGQARTGREQDQQPQGGQPPQ